MHHAVCQTSGDRLCNSVSTTPGGISAACQGAARQRGRRIAQASVGARGRRRPSPSQAHSCARTGLLPDLSGRWRVARRRIYGDESASRIVCCPDAAAAFRSTLRLIATNDRARIGRRVCALPSTRTAARGRVVPISELVFGALTQSRSSLEDRTTTRRCHRG